MLTAQTIVTFFGVSLLLGFTPGPDNIFVMLQSAAYGRKSGFYVVLGLCTGLIFHTAAVAGGSLRHIRIGIRGLEVRGSRLPCLSGLASFSGASL